MAESHIEEKLENPTKQQVDRIIDLTAQYIAGWTQQEFSRIAKSRKTPLIWSLPSGGFIVGRDRVIPTQGHWQVYNNHGEPQHLFEVKQSAIFYSLCCQIKNYQLSDAILRADHEVAHHKNDVMHYEYVLKSAKKQQDLFRISILEARLQDARIRLSAAQNQLQKSVKSAKYLKSWAK